MFVSGIFLPDLRECMEDVQSPVLDPQVGLAQGGWRVRTPPAFSLTLGGGFSWLPHQWGQSAKPTPQSSGGTSERQVRLSDERRIGWMAPSGLLGSF